MPGLSPSLPPDAPPPDRIGTIRLQHLLGRGAMGEVWAGIDEALGRAVAVKVLAGPEQDVEGRTRFDREAHALARLSHPNVVAVYSKGYLGTRPFFVMELVEGPSAQHLLEDGPMSPGMALQVVRQAALGLSAADAAGVVHRDVKPANLLVTADGTVKVADFGVCAIRGAGPGVTQDGTTLGTPYYMAPEQARGDPVDARADQYALGATLFHLLAGRPPYPGTQTVTQLLAHQKAPVPDLAEVAPGTLPMLARLVARMMAKEPAQRFDGYDALVAALEDVEAALAEGRVDDPAPTPPAATSRGAPASRAGPWLAAAVVASTVGVGGALWSMITAARPAPPPAMPARVTAAESPPHEQRATAGAPVAAAQHASPVQGAPSPGVVASPADPSTGAGSAEAGNAPADKQGRDAENNAEAARVLALRGPARVAALTAMTRAGAPMARTVLESMVRDAADPDAPLAAVLLGELGDQAATEALVGALASERRATVLAAVDALSLLRDVRAVEPLQDLSRTHGDATVRARAQRAGALLFNVEGH